MKIAILGYSGSGKSTLAKSLSNRFNLPLLYMDTVQFMANWQVCDKETQLKIVANFMSANDNWVIDGNYVSLYQEERLAQADYIVLMLFNRFDCLNRVLRRYKMYKNKSRESIADGCKEKIDSEFFWWIIWQGRSRKRQVHYKNIQKQYQQKVYVIKNQKQLDAFTFNPFANKEGKND